MLASLLFAKSVVVATKTTIGKVQTWENKVYKHLIGAAGYVTIAALRGEIGASMMESRIMETMLIYTRDILIGDFENKKKYMNHDIQSERGKGYKTTNEYRMKLSIT